MSSRLERVPGPPYRQRVYHVTRARTRAFRNPGLHPPRSHRGDRRVAAEDPLTDLSSDDLDEREGCAILLRRRDETFVGSTLASLCTSTLRGASYATSEVVITPDGMISWDRGFADDGSQVWGTDQWRFCL